MLKIIYIALLSLCVNNCLIAHNISFIFPIKEGNTKDVASVLDLRGEILHLPKNVTLRFKQGGCIKNGSIIADNTSIVGYTQNIFENVQIKGEWNVQYISTAMFKNKTDLNLLKSVLSLASDKVDNVVIIEDGDYDVAAECNGETILNVPSNTQMIINGTIRMIPNAFSSYSIIGLNGANIVLHGRGEIIGDKHTHKGRTGEWGMGVRLSECNKVDIYDITVKDCWGDCIYIGTESTDVLINNCTLVHGRRQGISITSASNVLIENCIIMNVGGTAPEYAIDIEPNDNSTVDGVIIRNVKSINCKGGFLACGESKNASINSIELYNCNVEGFTKADYAFNMCNDIKIIKCTSDKDSRKLIIGCKNVVIQEF